MLAFCLEHQGMQRNKMSEHLELKYNSGKYLNIGMQMCQIPSKFTAFSLPACVT